MAENIRPNEVPRPEPPAPKETPALSAAEREAERSERTKSAPPDEARKIQPILDGGEPRSPAVKDQMSERGENQPWHGPVTERTLQEPMQVYRIETIDQKTMNSLRNDVAHLPEKEREAALDQKVEAAFQNKLNDPGKGLWLTAERPKDLQVSQSENAIQPKWHQNAAEVRSYAVTVPAGSTVYEGATKPQGLDPHHQRQPSDLRGYAPQIFLPRDLDENRGDLAARQDTSFASLPVNDLVPRRTATPDS